MTQNPAKALYQQWITILRAHRGTGVHEHQGRLKGSAHLTYTVGITVIEQGAAKGGSDTRPNLGLGTIGRWGCNPIFALTSDGRFEIPVLSAGWGSQPRDTIEYHTFLTWFHDFKTYNWTAESLKDWRTAQSRGGWARDWNNPLPHVGEWAMDLSWGLSGNWLALKKRPTAALRPAWHIVPAKRPAWPQVDSRVESFAEFDRLRRQRLARAELKFKRQTGEIPYPSSRKPLTPEEREERTEEQQKKAATVLLAHFDVSTPARTTPLRRDREEALWAPAGSP